MIQSGVKMFAHAFKKDRVNCTYGPCFLDRKFVVQAFSPVSSTGHLQIIIKKLLPLYKDFYFYFTILSTCLHLIAHGLFSRT